MLTKVVDRVTEIVTPVYLVGGAVRDHLMGREVKDFDFTTPLTPDEIEELVRQNNPGRHLHLVGKRFGTIGTKVHIPDLDIFVDVEITTFREEVYSGTRKPDVTFVTDINEDLGRRDFTFNAIALRKKKGYHFIDPFGGQDDIAMQLIRAVGIPRQRFKEDPLRMLRAVRFVSTLGFTIDTQTMKHMTSGAVQILNISRERWTQELDRILTGPYVRASLEVLAQSNLLRFMIPELYLQVGYDQHTPHHDYTLWEHTIKVVDAVSKNTNDLDMLYAALLHDVGKPFSMTKKASGQQNYIAHELIGRELVNKIGRYLKWSNDRLASVRSLVEGHLAESSPLKQYDDGAQKRYDISES